MKLNVERHGSGPPMVLTHGIGDDLHTWDRWVPRLESAWTVTRWDQRGHGESERTADPEDYSPELALTDLEQVVTDAGPPVVLVGHSLGGYLSLGLAERRPELVRALVIIATGPGFRDPAARAKWNEMLLGSGDTLGLPEPVLHIGVQTESTVLDALSTISAPVFVVVGERDRRYHAATDLFAAKLGAGVLRVEGAGHHVHVTSAAVVVPAVLDFLARCGASAAEGGGAR